MTTIYWDVDTQVDFIHRSGLLAVPGAEDILPQLARLTAWAHGNDIRIVATADDHDVGHAEITDTPDWQTTFPPHCMRGTPGQVKVTQTALRDPMMVQPVPLVASQVVTSVQAHRGDLLLNKPGTDVFRWNPNAAVVLAALAPTRIVVYGVATDFCVRAAVSGLQRLAPDAQLVIATDAVRAINDAAGRALLTTWAAAGHQLLTTSEIVA